MMIKNILRGQTKHFDKLAASARVKKGIRPRNPDKRIAMKLNRRERLFPQNTLEKLDYNPHPWFSIQRVKALAKHYEDILNYSWRRNKLNKKEVAEFVKEQKKLEKKLVRIQLLAPDWLRFFLKFEV